MTRAQLTTGGDGISLLQAMFAAPVVGVSARWPKVLHAVGMDAVVDAWPRRGTRKRYAVAVCGASGLRLLSSGPHVVEWPPRVEGLAPDHERCRTCHELTGRKRPRSAFRRTTGA